MYHNALQRRSHRIHLKFGRLHSLIHQMCSKSSPTNESINCFFRNVNKLHLKLPELEHVELELEEVQHSMGTGAVGIHRNRMLVTF